MELEMDVEDLLNKRKLESDRIEFKTGGGRILMISTIVSVHLQMIIIMMAAVVLL